MNIPKNLYIELRETARNTQNNAFLLKDGTILTSKEYEKLNFSQRLELAVYYNFKLHAFCKI